ncbi:TPA: oligosaccharide flippase family protein, partial [Enterococcus faecium]|nr:oligosaccharide flippase family protein [Enterococcus faecium]HBM6673137.1 oligosaccharide flippase family protein [Enterococcus faecium]
MTSNNLIVKTLSRYKNTPLPVKAALWFMVCGFLQRGVSMITTPIFTRVLSTEQYGLYSTYLSWESLLLMITSLSLFKAMMNLYVKYDNQEHILSTVSGLTLVLTIFWFVIAIFIKDILAEILGLTPVLVVCMFSYFIFQAEIQCWSLHKRYIYDYKTLLVATLAVTVGSSVVGCLAVLFISPTAEARALMNVLVTGVVGVAVYISVFRRCKDFKDNEVWNFAVVFCVSLMPHYLSEFILNGSDKIMINYLCGSSDVAIYSVAYSIGALINLVTNSVNSTFAPYQYQKIKSGEYDLLSKRANEVLGLVAAMLFALMLFSKEIVLIFGGQKYIDSVNLIVPICIGIYFNYMFQLFARVQEYFEKKLTVVIPSVLCAIMNIVLNYVFIKLYGYQAVAYTTVFSYMFFCVIHYIFYRKVCKELLDGKNIYDVRGILLISAITIAGGILISIINKFDFIKYLIIAIACVAAIIFRKRLLLLVRRI